jgi:hypothetical protein
MRTDIRLVCADCAGISVVLEIGRVRSAATYELAPAEPQGVFEL